MVAKVVDSGRRSQKSIFMEDDKLITIYAVGRMQAYSKVFSIRFLENSFNLFSEGLWSDGQWLVTDLLTEKNPSNSSLGSLTEIHSREKSSRDRLI